MQTIFSQHLFLPAFQTIRCFCLLISSYTAGMSIYYYRDVFFLFVFFFFFFFFFFSEIAILHEPSATSDLGIHCLLRTLALCFIEPMEIQALQACGYYYYFFFFVRHLTKPVTGQGSPPERACHHIKRNFTIKL